MIGSGRIGYSLSPDHFRQLFGQHSDLDISIVSENLFRRLVNDYTKWEQDYIAGTVKPRNERERRLWNENMSCCPINIKRGFIDSHKIPTWARYPYSQSINNALWHANEKLKLTAKSPLVRRISLRVFQTWDSFVLQSVINLDALRKRYP